jgi:hypothetical protein
MTERRNRTPDMAYSVTLPSGFVATCPEDFTGIAELPAPQRTDMAYSVELPKGFVATCPEDLERYRSQRQFIAPIENL